MSQHYFSGRNLVIATKHLKESVIAPLCEELLNVNCIVPKKIDTDQFGMFSNEIERTLTPLESAKQKCLLAMELLDVDLAIASEGSFGQHPDLFFSSADDEIVMLYDRRNDIEIVGRKLSTNTNFGGALVKSLKEARAIADDFKFPDHALIIRSEKNSLKPICKGVNTNDNFERNVETMLLSHGQVWIETDMRAMYNPTRMTVIKEATINLIEKINSTCPECEQPGFWVEKAVPGLQCEICSFPTKSILSHEYLCYGCGFQKVKKYPTGKLSESAQYCDICNP